jgi:hypothetical protein
VVERQHLTVGAAPASVAANGDRVCPDRRPRQRWRRRWWAVALVLLVVLGHAWVGRQLALTMAAWHDNGPSIAPVDVVVEGALKPMEPVRKTRPPPPAVQAAPVVSEEGSSLVPAPVATVAEAAVPSTANAEQTPPPPASEPVAAAAAEPERVAVPVDPWPPSTRIRYTLKGNFRGEFHGSAQVLWLREGDRYRVEVEVMIGPRAAPLFARKVASEGGLGSNGLVPVRYEEETRVLFSRTRRVAMSFEPGVADKPGTLVLQDGTRRPAPVGTQDSASQFVQLAWLFSTNPTPVQAGDKVSFPLALSRRSDQWSYVVGEPEMVDTPAGPVQAIHARPQRELDPLRRDLIAEVWFAPALQYLPVRMQVIVDADTFAMMVMDGLPERVKQGPPPPAQGGPTSGR